jgi:hypothetical protein
MMSLASLPDIEPSPDHIGPIIYTLEEPVSYDEDTEVKTGGAVAMAVVWPENEFKLMLCVQREHRHEGHGKALLRNIIGSNDYITTWVSRSNTSGQMLLLKCGLLPTAMNSAGALRYCTPYYPADGED